MYTIKRHILLNLYYLHDQYSGAVTDDYEVMEVIKNWQQAQIKLKEYQSTTKPMIDGLFENYIRYEHIKGLWGDLEGIQPSIGQLFFICSKEMHSKMRILFELCEVKSIQEPKLTYYNHATSKSEVFTFGQYQGLALISERDELFIQHFEKNAGIRYPRNLIATLSGCTNYRQVRHKCISLSQYQKDWDLPKVELRHSIQNIGA